VTNFVESSSQRWVLVRSPKLADLAAELARAGATVRPGTDDSIEVAGLDSRSIGDLAFERGLPLHELATQGASLEDAFMEMTRDSVEFRGNQVAR
jgi:ABC-2 type transport system ATP-binding protein